MLGGHGGLAVPQDRGLELDVAGLVHAVDVAEGGGEHEAANAVECLIDLHHVLRSRIELFVGLVAVVHSVFLAADHSGFDLQNDLHLGAFGE